MDWQLKGQGAANLVFSYSGDNPNLVGHVVRARKTTAHTTSTIDQVIWSDVLQLTNDDVAQHDLSYIKGIMAPLLGRQYVFPGEYAPIPSDLLPLLERAGGRADAPALILPDHTTFLSCAVPGYAPMGPAVCLEVKPKCGLWPGCRAKAAAAPVATDGGGDVPGGAAAAGPAAAAATAAPTGPAQCRAAAGDTATAPRSDQGGFPGPEPGAGGRVGAGQQQQQQLYPRFMLHMLLKHLEDGVPFSLYNPLDLFSGDEARMRKALWCLLESPSNNLRVFKDGGQVYGSGAAGLQRHPPTPTPDPQVGAAHITDRGAAASSPASGCPQPDGRLASLAVQLQSLVQPGGSDDDGGEVEAQAARGAAAEEVAHAVAAPGGAAGGACLADLAGGMLGAVVRLAAMALRAEGVMERLHSAQGLDCVGPEGALQIFQQLQEALRGRADATAAAPAELVAALAAAAPSPALAAMQGLADEGGVGGAACTGWAPRLEALRRYLTSVTAKDCGVMVTLQRARRAGAAGRGSGKGEGAASEEDGSLAPGSADGVSDSTSRGSRPWARLLRDPETGLLYMYKVAFVDLDLKAASKIPKHVELDQRLSVCARENARLLAELAARAGWPQ